MSDQASLHASKGWVVSAPQSGMRLDRFAHLVLPQLSRRQLERAIRGKSFLVNGRPCLKGERLRARDVVQFAGPELLLAEAPPPNFGLEVPIVYEDGDLVVLDKPAGLDTHGFSGRDTRTLASFLAARRPETQNAGGNRWESGLIHRLDRETSGLIVAAKTRAAYQALRTAFATRRVRKRYWALVSGKTPARGRISYPLAHAPRDSRRMVAIVPGGRQLTGRKRWPAVTRYRVAARFRDATLLRVEMETGVTHQIRAHLAAIGHPIVGDRTYGGAEHPALGRHFLHAFELELPHPSTGKRLTVRSPLPADLEEFVSRLRAGD
ncbi:MAG TPA: RluA family pseudouridine synthase [candidate division Zixibacteria bacterium]|nr:RluA family pseudouridine synthase [candidate division Zixibacteria bacterium]